MSLPSNIKFQRQSDNQQSNATFVSIKKYDDLALWYRRKAHQCHRLASFLLGCFFQACGWNALAFHFRLWDWLVERAAQ